MLIDVITVALSPKSSGTPAPATSGLRVLMKLCGSERNGEISRSTHSCAKDAGRDGSGDRVLVMVLKERWTGAGHLLIGLNIYVHLLRCIYRKAIG